MRFTRDEHLVKNLGCCFLHECPCCSCLNFSGRSTFTRFRDDTRSMVVIFCVVFILVVGVSRVCGLLVCCWLGWVVAVVSEEAVGRPGCFDLSTSSHFELSFVVVSQVMSLVRSLLSRLVLSDCQ